MSIATVGSGDEVERKGEQSEIKCLPDLITGFVE